MGVSPKRITKAMKNPLNEEIVFAIKSYLPQEQKAAAFLMNLLFLGKESIYRRLRGEIPFTYEEVVAISGKLGFSIDSIIGLKNSNRAVFDLSFHKGDDWEELYFQKVVQFDKMFAEVRRCKIVNSIFAMNSIPYALSGLCQEFTRFRYFKWAHQIQQMPSGFAFSDLVLPQRIVDYQKRWKSGNSNHVHITYILDQNVFSSAAKDIDYFYRRNLINEEELQLLKNELLMIIGFLEEVAKNGGNAVGSPFLLYVSSIDVGSTCSYFEYDDNVCCHIQVYGIDVLQSYLPQVCQAQKEWLEQLRRYSTLITQSGEMLRFEYFKKQRDHIIQIGKN